MMLNKNGEKVTAVLFLILKKKNFSVFQVGFDIGYEVFLWGFYYAEAVSLLPKLLSGFFFYSYKKVWNLVKHFFSCIS